MIKEIVKDLESLSKVSTKVEEGEMLKISKDLRDTAIANEDRACGLAAPQIGYLKRMIALKIQEKKWNIMVNPLVISHYSGTYLSTEGCLSLEGERKTTRYRKIALTYRDLSGNLKYQKFEGNQARIIQHEIDHLNGVLI